MPSPPDKAWRSSRFNRTCGPRWDEARIPLIVLLGLLAAGRVASAGNPSGTYVGLYTNAADLLQIVERPDGSLLGHFEQVILSADGIGINRLNASVSGAVNGETLVLTLRPADVDAGADLSPAPGLR